MGGYCIPERLAQDQKFVLSKLYQNIPKHTRLQKMRKKNRKKIIFNCLGGEVST